MQVTVQLMMAWCRLMMNEGDIAFPDFVNSSRTKRQQPGFQVEAYAGR